MANMLASCQFKLRKIYASLMVKWSTMFHQLVANFVRLPFGTEQVAYRGFIRAYSLKAAACSVWKQG